MMPVRRNVFVALSFTEVLLPTMEELHALENMYHDSQAAGVRLRTQDEISAAKQGTGGPRRQTLS